MRPETKRLWGFLLCSAAILGFLSFLFPRMLSGIGGYENETTMPTDSQSRRALLALLPALMAYCISIGICLMPAPRRLQKLTFPLASFTLFCLLGGAGAAWLGQAFGWALFAALPLEVIIVVGAFFWGWRRDRRDS